jgi:hypothetical protein
MFEKLQNAGFLIHLFQRPPIGALPDAFAHECGQGHHPGWFLRIGSFADEKNCVCVFVCVCVCVRAHVCASVFLISLLSLSFFLSFFLSLFLSLSLSLHLSFLCMYVLTCLSFPAPFKWQKEKIRRQGAKN